MKIIAAHLLNDYTGSPKVLSQLVEGWMNKKLDVQLMINKNSEGFLTHTPGIKHYFDYKWSSNRIVTLFRFIRSQISLFLKTLQIAKKEDVVYINTILPAGAALAGKLKGSKVIYHIHETSVRPALLKKSLFKIADYTSSKALYVSEYLKSTESSQSHKSIVIHNSLNADFLEKAEKHRTLSNSLKNVLMVCSHKAYKGIYEYVEIARLNPDLNFTLVLSTDSVSIARDSRLSNAPINLQIFPLQKDLHPFYKQSDLVFNLSNPEQWVETFGLTILEGMAYGCPAIVPNIGGIMELVKEGYNGYWVNPADVVGISVLLKHLVNNPDTFIQLQQNALKQLNCFDEKIQIKETIKAMC